MRSATLLSNSMRAAWVGLPQGSLKGGAGCGHGGIHFFPARFVHKPYQAVVHGAAVFKSFAALRADIHAVDKMFEFLHGWFPE